MTVYHALSLLGYSAASTCGALRREPAVFSGGRKWQVKGTLRVETH